MSKKSPFNDSFDGWGNGDQGKDDVIFNTPTPYWDSLLADYPHSELQASGENVGICLTDKWVTLRWDTWISVPDVSFTKIW